MSQVDLQLGGGYTYQWECAVLLALNYLLDVPLEYNAELHTLISGFLGQLEAIHLEGEIRGQEEVDLEDINLLSADKAICIQVKAKESESERWVPSDPLLAKALYRFYCNHALNQDEPPVRFVFLSNRSFNPDLVQLKKAIVTNTANQSKQAGHLFRQVQQYVTQNHPSTPPMSKPRFDSLLNCLAMVEFLQVDAVEANVEGKLQALGVGNWQQAYEHLYTRFSKGSVQKGGIRITRADLMDSLKCFAEPLRVPSSALYRLPTDISDFTGRETERDRVISILERAMQGTGTAVPICAIAGMGGIGKSALAIHIAHQLRDHFPDGQLYIELRGTEGQPKDPSEALAELLRALGTERQSIPERLDERASLYRSLLSNRPTLVLLDNAYDEVQIRPLLPGNPHCAVLITSRGPLSALEGAAVVDLPLMPKDKALELLERVVGAERIHAELETAKQIVALCGRLPLAVRIAGATLKGRPHWSLGDYASQLADEQHRLKRLQRGDLGVRACFALSYRDLSSDDAHLFRMLGTLSEPGFTTEMATALLQAETDAVWDSLERLVDLRLLESAGNRFYRYHDLMHLFARERLAEEESAEAQQAARSRVDRWYLMASEVHFYAQAEVLERHAHSINPSDNREMLETILTVLQTREDLRRYFFRSGPSAAWAPILYERGFFEKPPPPQKTEQGYMLPSWDVLYYLSSVAAQVPNVVVQVAESFEEAGWYISLVVRALRDIPIKQAAELLPRIIAWLDEPHIAAAIADETADLVAHLAQGKRLDAALDLMHALTAPIPSAKTKTVSGMVLGAEAQPKFLNVHDYEMEQFFESLIPRLASLAPERVVTALQEHLCTAIRMEAESLGEPEFETWSGWRTAIEDTGQDLDNAYRDRLLRALRDALEAWVKVDAPAAGSLIRQYLQDKKGILRRLGFHTLHRFPTRYKTLVIEELQRFENLDDVGIHHEFLMLLQAGFPQLDASGQEALVAAICDGPSPERMRELAEWAKENKDIRDVDEYSCRHAQNWIRERLWMLQSYLSGEPAELLERLNSELGPPQIPPGFTRWSSGGAVRDISPISEQELAEMPPEELARYAEEWRPDPRQSSDLEWVTYQGLAEAVSQVILAAPEKYEQQTARIALHHPEFAYALLRRIRDDKPATPEAWEFSIRLCEALLGDQTVRTDMTRAFDGSWVEVRRAILHLIELGLNNEQHRPPQELLPRVRDILLTLLDDPDPDAETDRPPEGYFEHEDPATVAINAVRSRALLSLIEYAELRARLAEEEHKPAHEGLGPKRLEPVVQEALARKLNRQEDPSWAVHSVYGRHLFRLFWLDQEWAESHINEIFPEREDEDSIRYYTAAWDSYVVYHRYWHPDLELLRPKYERAIHNLGRGHVTKMHAGVGPPETGLAIHVAGEYLRTGYDLRSPAGTHNLMRSLYQIGTPQARSGVSWFFWRILENPNDREMYWPKVRAVWKWRVEAAAATNHSVEFDDEMQGFALLLPAVPKSETIESLWPLLEASLPHITRSEHKTREWDAFEKYLAAEVDRDPVKVIGLYRRMHELSPRRQWYRVSEEATQIIEKAARNKSAHGDVLALIDLFARKYDNHQFRCFYEQLERQQ